MQKEYKTRHDWVEKIIHWELCKKIKIWPYEQMVYVHPKIRQTTSLCGSKKQTKKKNNNKKTTKKKERKEKREPGE